ncbi:hypothetical protein SDJN02_04272 [Cucurbita argyrosperma subsp. argyrosperma]|nr:hypothetical protein SDJN02_04272 [Cucurbita argyrosperma subsp. argyrosperma]
MDPNGLSWCPSLLILNPSLSRGLSRGKVISLCLKGYSSRNSAKRGIKEHELSTVLTEGWAKFGMLL